MTNPYHGVAVRPNHFVPRRSWQLGQILVSHDYLLIRSERVVGPGSSNIMR